VPKIGGVGARVISVDGNNVKLSESLTVAMTNYTVRLSDGLIRSGAVVATLEDETLVLDNATGIESDDLIVFGNTERVTQEYLVQEIIPGANLTAELTLVRYVAAVYKADEGEIPPWDAGLTDTVVNVTDLKVVNLIGSSRIVYDNRVPLAWAEIKFEVAGAAYFKSNIYLIRDGFDRELVGDTKDFTFVEIINTIFDYRKLGIKRYFVEPINVNGIVGTGAYVDIEVKGDVLAPAAVIGFSVNVQSEIVQMFWQASPEEDIDYYTLRYTPEVINPAWESSQLLSQVSWQTTHTSAGARTGTYMITCTDTSGNESPVVYSRTTVAVLPNMNMVELIEEHLDQWQGAKYLTETDGIILYASGLAGEVQPLSYYRCRELVDLGAIYECRISSLIQAFGRDEDTGQAYRFARDRPQTKLLIDSGDWDAWVEVRCSSTPVFIDSWQPMSDVDPIAYGAPEDVWTEWRAVEVGDFTGQWFQFRILFYYFQHTTTICSRNRNCIFNLINC
jgi:hypothetical protein